MFDTLQKKHIKLLVPIKEFDKQKEIKEKIFISTNSENFIKYIPDFIVLVDKNNFYSLYDYFIQNNLIFKYNILNNFDISNENVDIVAKDFNIDKNSIYILLGIILQEILKQSVSSYTKNLIESNRNLHKELSEYYISLANTKNVKTSSLNKIIVKNSEGSYNYTILSCLVNVQFSEYIDLLKLFKKMQLSENLPYLAMIYDKKSYIKVYKPFTDKNLLDSWLLKNNTLKNIKGLNFKLKIFNQYMNCSIYSNGSFHVLYNFNDSINVQDLIKINKQLNPLFLNIKKHIPIDTSVIKYNNINIKFHTKFVLSYNELIVNIQNNSDFSISRTKYNDIIYFIYKNTTPGFITTAYINDLLHYNINLTLKNIIDSDLNEDKIFNTIKNISSVFIRDTSLPKNSLQKILNNSIKIKKDIHKKTKANIKLLKEKGIINKPVNCQKIRQPKIQNEINTIDKAKSIIYNNNTYTCPSKKYPYIGVTITKDICCFKKNQQNKPTFLSFSEHKKEFEPDFSLLQDLFKQHILKTNKILNWGRLAYFNINKKMYYRLGNYNNTYTLLNAFNLVTKQNIKIDDILNNINKNQFDTLYSSKFTNIESYKKYILNKNLNKEEIINDSTIILYKDYIDLLIFKYNLNCIIINNLGTQQKYEYFISDFNLPFCLLYLHSNGHFEIIISSLKKFTFNFDDPLIQNILLYIKLIPSNIDYISSKILYYNYLKNKDVIQVKSDSNIHFLITQEYGIIPTNQFSPELNISSKIKTITIKNINNYLLPLQTQYSKINKFIKDNPKLADPFTVIAQIQQPYTNVFIGLKLKNGLFIPTKNTTKIKNLTVSIENYFLDFYEFENVNENTEPDSRLDYIIKRNYILELYQRLQLVISKNLQVEKITKILENTDSYYIKLYKIQDILNTLLSKFVNITDNYLPKNIPLELPIYRLDCVNIFCNKISKSNGSKLNISKNVLNFMLLKIANELLLYNKTHQILTKKVSEYKISKDNYIIRKDEAIILDIKKLKQFIKQK